MIKFFGLLSKKKKISSLKTTNLLVATLDEVIVNGFVEIQDFINNNNNLERNPNHIYVPTLVLPSKSLGTIPFMYAIFI